MSSIVRPISLALTLCLLAPYLGRATTNIPPSCCPALDQAAAALAQSRFDLAARGFDQVSNNPENPPFVRGLGLLGLAQTTLAQNNGAAAINIWRQLAADTTQPQWLRGVAERRILETLRAMKHLPERNPDDYKANLPPLPHPTLVIYVSPTTTDTADGTKRRPFATLQKARDAIRALKKSAGGNLPQGGVRVLLLPGNYSFNEPLRLTAEDSGRSDAPIVYQAQRAGTTVLTGGTTLKGWKPIVDKAVRERLSTSVRDRVLETDLNFNGITDFGDATALKKRPELFVDGLPQTLARWPNEGFVKTGEILGTNTFKVWGSIPGSKDGKFRFTEDRPKGWARESDIRLYGYWFWDWYEEYQKVAAIDANANSFTLAPPFSNYGYRKGQRYYAVNLFSELDQPGEWYLNRETGKIYWLPPEKVRPSKAEIVLSIRSEPFITLANVEHVILQGLTIQEGRGDGILITGGVECIVAGCTIQRLGGDALVIEGGLHHTVFGCLMRTLGCGGIRVNGGDRNALSPGRHLVENCTVSDISRLKRTYTPAVHMDGCGNRIAHNLFEHIPSSAMRIEGNDHLIELNRIRHVVEESDDQGGIDMFGNPLYRGVVIRWNHWSDITGGTECGAAGIRLDDMISGIVLQGNLFERCGAVQFGGVQIHGGKENVVDANVFVDCFAGISFSRWDATRWLESIKPFEKQAQSAPYAARYPDLADLKTKPNVNFVSRNLLFNCKNVFLRDGGVEPSALMFVTDGAPPAELLKTGTLRKKRLPAPLFDPIPVCEIGPYPHPWAATSPRSR